MRRGVALFACPWWSRGGPGSAMLVWLPRSGQHQELVSAETNSRAVAQLGSALDWGSRGRRFKSCQPDRIYSGIRLSQPCLGEHEFEFLVQRLQLQASHLSCTLDPWMTRPPG